MFILLTILCIVGCGSDIGKDYSLDEKSFDADTLKMIEQRTGIQLPSDAQGLNMFYQGSQIDPSFIAKIKIPQSSREAIARQIKEIPNKDGSVSGSLAEKVNWWTPSKSTIHTERQFTVDMNYVHAILCQENGRWILYVEWIKT